MSVYYKYEFTSPEPIFALIQEELKSYFDTSAIDNTLFSLWTDKCLKKLGKASYPINQALLLICNFEARIPDDFHAMREAWSCEHHDTTYQLPNAHYHQVKETSIRLDDPDLFCDKCNECQIPDVIQAIYKTTRTVAFSWRKTHLLKPGNMYPSCPHDMFCANHNSSSADTYDVRDNKFVTNFRDGRVYIQYYSNQFDGENQLIPDDYYIKEFIEAFIKQKIFEQLANQSTDETFRQIEAKAQKYKQMADEAYILADIENKKEDVYRKQRAIRRVRNRYRKYDIR